MPTRQKIPLIPLILILVMFLVSVSFAESIKINITSEIIHVEDREDILNGEIKPGDIISGYYIYNSETPDTDYVHGSLSETVGRYWHYESPYGIFLRTGDYIFQTDPNNTEFVIEIVNDHGSLKRDNYLLRSDQNRPTKNNIPVRHISWQLDDETGQANSSDDLPSTPPCLQDWESVIGLTIDMMHRPPLMIRAHVISAFKEPYIPGSLEILEVIGEKEAAIEEIEIVIEKEIAVYAKFEKLLESGDYDELKKSDIVKAMQKIHSAIQHEEQSLHQFEQSIEKLYDALESLGWEAPIIPD